MVLGVPTETPVVVIMQALEVVWVAENVDTWNEKV